jgi:hypothetical protein
MLNIRHERLVFGSVLLLASTLFLSANPAWSGPSQIVTQSESSAREHGTNEASGSGNSEAGSATGPSSEASSQRGTESVTESSSESGGGFLIPGSFKAPNTAFPSGLPPYLNQAPTSDYVKSPKQPSDYVKSTQGPSDYVKSTPQPSDYVKSVQGPSDYVKSPSSVSDYVKSLPEPSSYTSGSDK